MDQAAPADQVVLWHLSERSEESDMGRVVHLSARGHREKAARYSMLPYTLLQIPEVNIFEKKPIISLVSEALKQPNETVSTGNQLNLFGN